MQQCTTKGHKSSSVLMPFAMLGKLVALVLLVRVSFSHSRGASLSERSMTGVDIALPVHRRGLQQDLGCSSLQWQCSSSNGQQTRLSDSVHVAIITGNCSQISALLNLWQCGSNLVQGDMITAVHQGSCLSDCTNTEPQHCASPPAPTPAPAPSEPPSIRECRPSFHA